LVVLDAALSMTELGSTGGGWSSERAQACDTRVRVSVSAVSFMGVETTASAPAIALRMRAVARARVTGTAGAPATLTVDRPFVFSSTAWRRPLHRRAIGIRRQLEIVEVSDVCRPEVVAGVVAAEEDEAKLDGASDAVRIKAEKALAPDTGFVERHVGVLGPDAGFGVRVTLPTHPQPGFLEERLLNRHSVWSG